MASNQSTEIARRSPAFHERRQFGRRATFKRGVLVAADGFEMRCIVVDLSDGGARLTAQDAERAPATFDLVVAEDDFTVACAVMHRTDNSLGVRFERAPRRLSWAKREHAPAPPTGDPGQPTSTK